MRSEEDRLVEEQHLQELKDEHRRAHVDIVYQSLTKATAMHTSACRRLAEIAVDALLDDGVVFARMGTCESDTPN